MQSLVGTVGSGPASASTGTNSIVGGGGNGSGSTMSPAEQTATKFASLLGTKGAMDKPKVASALSTTDPSAAVRWDMMKCVSKTVKHHEVICSIPSLDIRNPDEDGNPSLPVLPDVGEHFSVTEQESVVVGGGKPHMEASVLSNAADASAKAAQVEQKAAQTLGSLTSWTKSSVMYAPTAIANNVADSFSSLVDSRVRAWTLLLLRHSLTTGDSASRSRLMTMLSSIIKVDSARTTFKALPLPESATNQPKEADVILPLLFEVDMQVSIQNKADTVTIRAPGTVAANFDRNPDGTIGTGLKNIDVRLDTGALLDLMVQQARMVVFKAVAKATKASDSMNLDSKADTNRDMSTSPLSAFSSALTLSSSSASAATSGGLGTAGGSVAPGPNQPAHRLQKAKTSALKLGSILAANPDGPSGGNATFVGGLDKSKKTRSVQWDSKFEYHASKNKPPTGLSSPSKRQKMVTTARLTSFKSFGRPHAGDFGSGPKNATFGNFGRGPIWGRDGKLANKPTPMLPSETTDILTSQVRRTANATFDTFQKPPIHLSSGMDLGIGKRAGMAKDSNSNRLAQIKTNAMPRTATTLEGALLDQISNNMSSG